MLKTEKNGCPGERLRQWAFLEQSSQAVIGVSKL